MNLLGACYSVESDQSSPEPLQTLLVKENTILTAWNTNPVCIKDRNRTLMILVGAACTNCYLYAVFNCYCILLQCCAAVCIQDGGESVCSPHHLLLCFGQGEDQV